MEKSVSAASQAARRKCYAYGLPHIPWVAKWFTAGQAALKFLQLLSCSIAVIVLFTWSKDPSSVFSFENLVFEDARGQLDFRPHWYFFASVGLFTSAYALLLPAAGFVGLNVWPLTRTVLSIFCTLLWLVGGPVMSSAITLMEASRYANENLVDFLMPKVATGIGFLSLGLFVMDVLLALMALREHQTSDKFIKEVASMSVITRTSAKPQAPSTGSQPPPTSTTPITGPTPAGSQPPPASSHTHAASPTPTGSQPPLASSHTPAASPTPTGSQTPPAGSHTPAGSQTPSAGSQASSPQIQLYVSAHSTTPRAEEWGTASQPLQETSLAASPSKETYL